MLEFQFMGLGKKCGLFESTAALPRHLDALLAYAVVVIELEMRQIQRDLIREIKIFVVDQVNHNIYYLHIAAWLVSMLRLRSQNLNVADTENCPYIASDETHCCASRRFHFPGLYATLEIMLTCPGPGAAENVFKCSIACLKVVLDVAERPNRVEGK